MPISNLHFCLSPFFFSPLWLAHSHTHTHNISNPCTLQNTLYFLCVFVSVGSLAGGIQSCQRWSRCCSISSHQSSPTLLPTSSTSASETTRSSPRYWSPRRSRTRREGLETRRVLKTLLEGALTLTHSLIQLESATLQYKLSSIKIHSTTYFSTISCGMQIGMQIA